MAIVGVLDCVHLVDEISHRQRMILGGTEHDSFLALVNLLHKDLDPFFLAGADLDDAVHILLGVNPLPLYFSLNHLVIRGVDVLIQCGGMLAHSERGQVTIVDPLFEGVAINWLAKVGIGIDVIFTLWGCGQPQLHGGFEVVEDIPPVALVVGTATVALINDDEVEEIGGVVTKYRGWFALGIGASHKGLEDGEEDIAILGGTAFLSDLIGGDPHQSIFREGRETVERLIGQDIAVGQKQDAGTAGRFTFALPVIDVPATMKQLPG